MVRPTCTSLTCAIVKPCSARGRSASGIRTRTMRARRRAFAKPTPVATKARPSTPGAEPEHHRAKRERKQQRARESSAEIDRQVGEDAQAHIGVQQPENGNEHQLALAASHGGEAEQSIALYGP